MSLPCCLLTRCRFPVSCDLARLLPSRPRRHLVRSCVLLPRMCRRRGAGDAVRSLRLLPRWSVLIMFKMLPYQSFKTLRLFDMALLCGYRDGGVRSIASLPHLGFISSVSGLGLIACVLCIAARPSIVSLSASPASRLPPCPPDTIDGAEARGRHTARSAERMTGRAVSSELSCVRAAACPMRAPDHQPSCRSPYRRRFSVPAWRRRSPVLIMLAIHYRPRLSTRETGSRAGRVLARRCG